MLAIALQMVLGNDTTLSHAVRRLSGMSDRSVTIISARKTQTEGADLTFYSWHMASKEFPSGPLKEKALKEALLLKTQRLELIFLFTFLFFLYCEHMTETHDEVFGFSGSAVSLGLSNTLLPVSRTVSD